MPTQENATHRHRADGARPRSLQELTNVAKDEVRWDESMKVTHWLRKAEDYREKAKAADRDNDIEHTFLELAKSTEILHKLKEGFGYRTFFTDEQRDGMGKNMQAMIDKMYTLRPAIVERHELWKRQQPVEETSETERKKEEERRIERELMARKQARDAQRAQAEAEDLRRRDDAARREREARDAREEQLRRRADADAKQREREKEKERDRETTKYSKASDSANAAMQEAARERERRSQIRQRLEQLQHTGPDNSQTTGQDNRNTPGETVMGSLDSWKIHGNTQTSMAHASSAVSTSASIARRSDDDVVLVGSGRSISHQRKLSNRSGGLEPSPVTGRTGSSSGSLSVSPNLLGSSGPSPKQSIRASSATSGVSPNMSSKQATYGRRDSVSHSSAVAQPHASTYIVDDRLTYGGSTYNGSYRDGPHSGERSTTSKHLTAVSHRSINTHGATAGSGSSGDEKPRQLSRQSTVILEPTPHIPPSSLSANATAGDSNFSNSTAGSAPSRQPSVVRQQMMYAQDIIPSQGTRPPVSNIARHQTMPASNAQLVSESNVGRSNSLARGGRQQTMPASIDTLPSSNLSQRNSSSQHPRPVVPINPTVETSMTSIRTPGIPQQHISSTTLRHDDGMHCHSNNSERRPQASTVSDEVSIGAPLLPGHTTTRSTDFRQQAVPATSVASTRATRGISVGNHSRTPTQGGPRGPVDDRYDLPFASQGLTESANRSDLAASRMSVPEETRHEVLQPSHETLRGVARAESAHLQPSGFNVISGKLSPQLQSTMVQSFDGHELSPSIRVTKAPLDENLPQGRKPMRPQHAGQFAAELTNASLSQNVIPSGVTRGASTPTDFKGAVRSHYLPDSNASREEQRLRSDQVSPDIRQLHINRSPSLQDGKQSDPANDVPHSHEIQNIARPVSTRVLVDAMHSATDADRKHNELGDMNGLNPSDQSVAPLQIAVQLVSSLHPTSTSPNNIAFSAYDPRRLAAMESPSIHQKKKSKLLSDAGSGASEQSEDDQALLSSNSASRAGTRPPSSVGVYDSSPTHSWQGRAPTPRRNGAEFLPILPLQSPRRWAGDESSADERGVKLPVLPKGSYGPPKTKVDEREQSSTAGPPPLTTTSPRPPELKKVSFHEYMDLHQKSQGYTPSLHSLVQVAEPPNSINNTRLLDNRPSVFDEKNLNPVNMFPRRPGKPSQMPVQMMDPRAQMQAARVRQIDPQRDRLRPDLRPIHVPGDVLKRFTAVSAANTEKGTETLGLLMGKYKAADNKYIVTTLLIPRQRGGSDWCSMEDEEMVLQFQERRFLVTLGWIHTHPTQSCFMSSCDLHSHAPYQKMLPEAFAIVCAPKRDPNYGVFRLTDPNGLQHVLGCKNEEMFHEHLVKDLYTDCDKSHVSLVDSVGLEICDIRSQREIT